MQGSLSIERMCGLMRVSRTSFYRSFEQREPQEESMEVRSAIQRVALEHRRRYGYRRVTAELRRRGMPLNHKRVARIMREDNLLAVRRKQFVATTDSNHSLGGLSEPGAADDADGNQPALGGGHHLHPAAGRVCLFGSGTGRIFAQGGGLEAGPHTGEPSSSGCSGIGDCNTEAIARTGASLRPGYSIRLRRVCGDPAKARDGSEHEPAGQPV